jgi:hypothetical protein
MTGGHALMDNANAHNVFSRLKDQIQIIKPEFISLLLPKDIHFGSMQTKNRGWVIHILRSIAVKVL